MTEELLDECLKTREERDRLKKALEWIENPGAYIFSIRYGSFNAIYFEKNSIREKFKKAIAEELAEAEKHLSELLNS